MKKFLLIAFLVACFDPGAQAQTQGPIYCNATAFTTTISSATTTAIVPVPAGSSRIYICGYSFVAGSGAATMTMQLEYGSGTACATGPTALTPAASTAASTISGDNSDTWRGIVVPSGNGVCVVTTGTVSGAAQIYYAQQ